MSNNWLVAAGLLSLAVALFHVAAAFVPTLQTSFGAPESLIRAGRAVIGAAAVALAAVFALWGAYGLSGGGWLPRLPLLLPAVVAIGSVVAIGFIYALRGILLVPQLLAVVGLVHWDLPRSFLRVGSSAVSLTIGVVYLVGAAVGWSALAA